MANPFKEAEKKNKKAPGSKQKAVEEKETPEKVEPQMEEEKPVETIVEPAVKEEKKPVAKTEKKEAPKKQPTLDIFSKLEAEKTTKKTFTFYLTVENVEKLKKMAEKKGISDSKLLDHNLSEVL